MKLLSFFSDAVPLRNFEVGVFAGCQLYKLSFFDLRHDPELLEIRKRAFPDFKFLISSGFYELTQQDKPSEFDWASYSADYIKYLEDNAEYIDFAEAFLPYGFSDSVVEIGLEYFDRITDYLVMWPLDHRFVNLTTLSKYLVSLDTRFFTSFPLDQLSALVQGSRARLHLAEVGAKLALYTKCANLYSFDSGGWVSPSRYNLMPLAQYGKVETVPLNTYMVRQDFNQRVFNYGLPPASFFDTNLLDTRLLVTGEEVTKWHVLSVSAWREMIQVDYDSNKVNYFLRLAPSHLHHLETVDEDLVLAKAHISEEVSVNLEPEYIRILADIQNEPQQRLLEKSKQIESFIVRALNTEYPVDKDSIDTLNEFIAGMLLKKVSFPSIRTSDVDNEVLKTYSRKHLRRLDSLIEFVKVGSLILRAENDRGSN